MTDLDMNAFPRRPLSAAVMRTGRGFSERCRDRFGIGFSERGFAARTRRSHETSLRGIAGKPDVDESTAGRAAGRERMRARADCRRRSPPTEMRRDAEAAPDAPGDGAAFLRNALESMPTAAGSEGVAAEHGHAADTGKGISTA